MKINKEKKMFSSTNYIGIRIYKLKNDDKSYYFNYKNQEGKQVLKYVGRNSDGITEEYCSRMRKAYIKQISKYTGKIIKI